MKIYDCTSFYSEHMMYEVRLNILKDKVDKFIVTESTYSHSGKKKKLNHEQTIEILSMLSITRLEERKGLIPVLRALADLNDKKLLKPFLWKICGEGKQENEIKNHYDRIDF